MRKRKSSFYRDWKYKFRWNERATPSMDNHMSLPNLTTSYLIRCGVLRLMKIRRSPTYVLNSRFRLRKNISW